MEDIKRIIDKVRQMYKFDTNLKDVITQPVSVRINEQDGSLKIQGIIFNYFGINDKVTVVSDAIRYYKKETDEWTTLMEFRDFDESLGM